MRLGLSRSRRRKGKGIVAFLVLTCSVILVCVIIGKLQPAFFEYAGVYSNNIANSVVNDSINEVFSKEEYQSLAKIIENSGNNIKAIETDTVKINKLKADITQSIQNNIEARQSDTVYVPLGSATNFYFLAGLGPKIPIRIYPVSIVNTDFNEAFESVGINQVKHKLYLDVSIQMSFVGIAYSKADTVKTSTLLTETIIVGDTPDYYGSGNITAAVE